MTDKTDSMISKETLHKFFGFKNFLNVEQKRAMKIIFEGNHDVYLCSEPGSGKSLCFQLATVLKPSSVSVVFVPTHLLAEHQISFLTKNRIKAEYLCSRTRKKLQTQFRAYQNAMSAELGYQFLYVLIQQPITDFLKDFMVELAKRNALSYIVYDEAHCASSLGHHYIPVYKDIAQLVQEICPDVCKIALTSVPTGEVRRDFINILGIKNPKTIRSIKYESTHHEVCFKNLISKPLKHLGKFVLKMLDLSRKPAFSVVYPYCGIIFCKKNEVIRLVVEEMLSMKVWSFAYHGDLSHEMRKRIHGKWLNGEIPVIVTTSNFGVGLHKSGIKFVVHWDLPLSFQHFYRESGMATAPKPHCRVYYSFYDEENTKTLIKSAAGRPDKRTYVVTRQKLRFFHDVLDYCLRPKCRNAARLRYFGHKVADCKQFCDACLNPTEVKDCTNLFLKKRALMNKNMSVKLLTWKGLHVLDESANAEECKVSDKESRNDRRAYLGHDLKDNAKPIPTIEGITLTKRKRSYERLYNALMNNYKYCRDRIPKIVTPSHIAKIAHTLENSLFRNSILSKKYTRDVQQTIESTTWSTMNKKACGYLRYFEAREKWIFDPQSNATVDVVDLDDDDDDDKFDDDADDVVVP